MIDELNTTTLAAAGNSAVARFATEVADLTARLAKATGPERARVRQALRVASRELHRARRQALRESRIADRLKLRQSRMDAKRDVQLERVGFTEERVQGLLGRVSELGANLQARRDFAIDGALEQQTRNSVNPLLGAGGFYDQLQDAESAGAGAGPSPGLLVVGVGGVALVAVLMLARRGKRKR